jgi:hypothetical protein
VTHNPVTPIRQLEVLQLSNEGVGFGDKGLGQHAARSFAREFIQGIVDAARLTKLKDIAISRHGVSLLWRSRQA